MTCAAHRSDSFMSRRRVSTGLISQCEHEPPSRNRWSHPTFRHRRREYAIELLLSSRAFPGFTPDLLLVCFVLDNDVAGGDSDVSFVDDECSHRTSVRVIPRHCRCNSSADKQFGLLRRGMLASHQRQRSFPSFLVRTTRSATGQMS